MFRLDGGGYFNHNRCCWRSLSPNLKRSLSTIPDNQKAIVLALDNRYLSLDWHTFLEENRVESGKSDHLTLHWQWKVQILMNLWNAY